MKYLVAIVLLCFPALAVAYAPPDPTSHSYTMPDNSVATFKERWQVAQVVIPTPTNAPVTTTTVKGGDVAASIIEWLEAVFGTIIAGLATLVIVKIRTYFGILTTDAQKAQLQAITVNAVNSAALKAETAVRNNPKLDIDIQSAVVQDAVAYVQAHGAETIKALGLDPQSGDAVEAIKARIATAMNSPQTPTITPTAVTPTYAPIKS